MAKKIVEKDVLKTLTEMNVLNQTNYFVPTGIKVYDAFVAGEKDVLSLDIGHPTGKIIAISGDNGVGKSTLYLECSKRWCKNGYKVIYVDVEGGLNKKSLTDYDLLQYAAYDPAIETLTSAKEIQEAKEKSMIDFFEGRKTFLPIVVKTYRNTMAVLRNLFELNKKGEIKVIIIDSIKDLSSTMVFEDDEYIEKQPMMEDAKAQENFLKSVKNFISINAATCILLNQLRTKVKGQFYVLDEAGGQAFLHRCDIRLFIKERERIYQKVISNTGEEIEKRIGNWVEIEVRKGRFGNPFSKLYLPIIFGRGVSLIYLYKRLLDKTDVIKKSGSWYEFKMEELGILEKFQGDTAIYKIIKDNFAKIEEYIFKNNLMIIEKTKEEIESEIESSGDCGIVSNLIKNENIVVDSKKEIGEVQVSEDMSITIEEKDYSSEEGKNE